MIRTAHPELKRAMEILAGRCDGAHQLDGQGFSAFDVDFGHFLAQSDLWSPKAAFGAWRLAQKYRRQLSTAGVDADSLPIPPDPSTDEGREKIERLAERAGEESPTKTLAKAGDLIEIRFPYDPTLVAEVKEIPGRRWNPAKKVWTVPASREGSMAALAKFAKSHGFDLGALEADVEAAEKEEREKARELAAALTNSKATDADVEVEGLGGTLFPFQRAGVAYALQKRRALIADEMGLGKTVQALATIQGADAYPALIVCPASLKLNWEREARKWLPGRRVEVLNGTTPGLLETPDVLVVNYDILTHWADALAISGIKALVLDESHYVKNPKAKRTKVVQDLAKSSSLEVVLALTGTPVLNRPSELTTQLDILGLLNQFGGWFKFVRRYCEAYRDRFGWNVSGASNLGELNTALRSLGMVRRKKADVLKDLPPKRRSVVSLPLANPSEYRAAEAKAIAALDALAERQAEEAVQEDGFLQSIADLPEAEQRAAIRRRKNERRSQTKGAEAIVILNALKRAAVDGKLAAAKEWVRDFLDSGEKLVLFASHTAPIEELAREFGAPVITGSTPQAERQAAVDRFQNDDDCRLIIGNIRAMGVGLTLTAASNVAFLEMGWTPAEHDQAEDRCHRIGQEESVMAWYLTASGTIDDYVSELIEKKRAVVDAATDGREVEETSVLNELVARLRQGGE